MFLIEKEHLQPLALGAAFLGTGGGGDTYLARLMLERSLDNGKKIQVKKVGEFADDQLVVGVGYVGAPSIMTEKLPSGNAAVLAMKAMQQVIGNEIDAVIVIEIGGSNSLMPMFVASELDLPVVDGDGMGRAFPKVQMQTYSIYGEFSECIATVCNEQGEVITVRRRSASKMEQCLRDLSVTMGGIISVCLLPMTIAQLKKCIIADTVSVCLALGEKLTQLKRKHISLGQVLSFFSDTLYQKALHIFQGKVVDIHLENSGGFSIGNAIIQSFDGDKVLDVIFQNENLIAKINGEVLVTVPDLITILDMDTGTPSTCEGMRYGQRVDVVAVRAPLILQHEKALASLGPSVYGLPYTYQPIDI